MPNPVCRIDGSPRLGPCDAAIFGSLVKHHFSIGIRPVPPSPYKGISVESLAIGIKSLSCTVSWDKRHEECSIVGEVARRVDEVLAGLDKVDVWDSTWGQGRSRENYGDEVRMWPIEAEFELEPVYLQYTTGKDSIK